MAGRARFTGPGGGGPGEGTISISDAVFRASAGLVFSGASSGQGSSPIVAAEASVGTAVSVPAARWLALDEAEPSREIVHVDGIQVSVSEGVVEVRDGFGQPWFQPVFADEASVGGLVEVVDPDFGYLLSATEPYSSLWYSSDGSAWQLVDRDVVRIAGSHDSAIAVVGSRDAPSNLRIDSTRLAEVVAVDPSVIAADRLDRVDSLGYVAGPVAGAVWSALELGPDVESIHSVRTRSRFGLARAGSDTTEGRST